MKIKYNIYNINNNFLLLLLLYFNINNNNIYCHNNKSKSKKKKINLLSIDNSNNTLENNNDNEENKNVEDNIGNNNLKNEKQKSVKKISKPMTMLQKSIFSILGFIGLCLIIYQIIQKYNNKKTVKNHIDNSNSTVKLKLQNSQYDEQSEQSHQSFKKKNKQPFIVNHQNSQYDEQSEQSYQLFKKNDKQTAIVSRESELLKFSQHIMGEFNQSEDPVKYEQTNNNRLIIEEERLFEHERGSIPPVISYVPQIHQEINLEHQLIKRQLSAPIKYQEVEEFKSSSSGSKKLISQYENAKQDSNQFQRILSSNKIVIIQNTKINEAQQSFEAPLIPIDLLMKNPQLNEDEKSSILTESELSSSNEAIPIELHQDQQPEYGENLKFIEYELVDEHSDRSKTHEEINLEDSQFEHQLQYQDQPQYEDQHEHPIMLNVLNEEFVPLELIKKSQLIFQNINEEDEKNQDDKPDNNQRLVNFSQSILDEQLDKSVYENTQSMKQLLLAEDEKLTLFEKLDELEQTNKKEEPLSSLERSQEFFYTDRQLDQEEEVKAPLSTYELNQKKQLNSNPEEMQILSPISYQVSNEDVLEQRLEQLSQSAIRIQKFWKSYIGKKYFLQNFILKKSLQNNTNLFHDIEYIKNNIEEKLKENQEYNLLGMDLSLELEELEELEELKLKAEPELQKLTQQLQLQNVEEKNLQELQQELEQQETIKRSLEDLKKELSELLQQVNQLNTRLKEEILNRQQQKIQELLGYNETNNIIFLQLIENKKEIKELLILQKKLLEIQNKEESNNLLEIKKIQNFDKELEKQLESINLDKNFLQELIEQLKSQELNNLQEFQQKLKSFLLKQEHTKQFLSNLEKQLSELLQQVNQSNEQLQEKILKEQQETIQKLLVQNQINTNTLEELSKTKNDISIQRQQILDLKKKLLELQNKEESNNLLEINVSLQSQKEELQQNQESNNLLEINVSLQSQKEELELQASQVEQLKSLQQQELKELEELKELQSQKFQVEKSEQLKQQLDLFLTKQEKTKQSLENLNEQLKTLLKKIESLKFNLDLVIIENINQQLSRKINNQQKKKKFILYKISQENMEAFDPLEKILNDISENIKEILRLKELLGQKQNQELNNLLEIDSSSELEELQQQQQQLEQKQQELLLIQLKEQLNNLNKQFNDCKKESENLCRDILEFPDLLDETQDNITNLLIDFTEPLNTLLKKTDQLKNELNTLLEKTNQLKNQLNGDVTKGINKTLPIIINKQ